MCILWTRGNHSGIYYSWMVLYRIFAQVPLDITFLDCLVESLKLLLFLLDLSMDDERRYANALCSSCV